MEHEDFSALSNKKLKNLIKETEVFLKLMKQEMKSRKLDKQHEEIDHLEDHLGEADHSLSNLKTFIQKIFSERHKD